MRPVLFAPLALLVGCADITGIWLFEIPYQESSLDCSTQINENFTDGYVPQGTGPGVSDWVYTDEYTGSDAVGFGQIETYGDGSAVLVIGTAVFPGTEDGEDWIFTWSDSELVVDSEEHYEGQAVDYGFLRQDESVSTITYTFTPTDKRTATVKSESEGTTTTTWYETDSWGEEVADEIGTQGQIPSFDYLVVDGERGGTDAQVNDWEESDCTSNVCELAVQTTCSDEGEFTAHKTDFEDEDHYRSMRESGQPAG